MRKAATRMNHYWIFLTTALAIAAGCDDARDAAPASPAPTPATPDWFADVTASSGIAFEHDVGRVEDYFMPDSMGSGGAMADFDNDGRLDVLLVQLAGPKSGKAHQLFHQRPDGTFADVSAGSGLDVEACGMGAACGDVNNDGLVDVAITAYPGTRLFINTGNLKFVDVTHRSDIDNPHWGASAAFTDYDNDGLLDLFVANYVGYSGRTCEGIGGTDFCGPQDIVGTPSKLFRNTSPPGATPDGVRFDDVSELSGIGRTLAAGLGVVCADFTGDGWQDLFVTNDGRPNVLWVNRRDGTFIDEGGVRGVAHTVRGSTPANMGVGVADVDFNGHVDLLVTHLTSENPVLWRQTDAGVFADATGASGLLKGAWRGTGFGAVLTDFDNDGLIDLAMANGRIGRATLNLPPPDVARRLGPWAAYAERNQLFAGRDGGAFTDLSGQQPALCGEYNVARGLVAGDVDNDGGIDLLVCRTDAGARLYRNTVGARHNWITIRAVDPAVGGRDAYGASVAVIAGGRRYVHVVAPSYSYMSGNDPRVHVGLGGASVVDAIEITWPGGSVERFPGGPSRRTLTLAKGTGSAGYSGD